MMELIRMVLDKVKENSTRTDNYCTKESFLQIIIMEWVDYILKI